MDVYQKPEWWPFHPFETTVDQLWKDFMTISHSHNPEKRKHLLKAYLHDHAELLKAASIDTDKVFDHLSHSLSEILLG